MIHYLKSSIPNFLTLSNLFCGCLAICFLFIGKHQAILPLLLIALFADFFDGMIARLLNVKSPIGKDLDSLADMVSFGVLPAFLLVYLNASTQVGSFEDFNFAVYLSSIDKNNVLIFTFFPIITALFSALRLAKFNISTNQTDDFKGLATPAAALLIIGLFNNYINNISFFNFIYKPIYINILSLFLALLLVSNISMFSFKLKQFTLKKNYLQFIFILGGLALLFFFKFSALPLIILLYISLNLVKNISKYEIQSPN